MRSLGQRRLGQGRASLPSLRTWQLHIWAGVASASLRNPFSGFGNQKPNQIPKSHYLPFSLGSFHILTSNSPSRLIDNTMIGSRVLHFQLQRTEALTKGLKTAWLWLWEVFHHRGGEPGTCSLTLVLLAYPEPMGSEPGSCYGMPVAFVDGATLLNTASLNKAGFCSLL